MKQHESELADYKARYAANIPNPTPEQQAEYAATVERLEKAIAADATKTPRKAKAE
jgi:hypothetical protein